MKQHIAQIRGKVAPCMVANADQQKRCREACEAPSKKKKLKAKHDAEVAAKLSLKLRRMKRTMKSLLQLEMVKLTAYKNAYLSSIL